MTPTPKIVKDCIAKAELILHNEHKVNARYKDLQRQGKSFSESEFANNTCLFRESLHSFKEKFFEIAERYPEWIKVIPKVHLPIAKR